MDNLFFLVFRNIVINRKIFGNFSNSDENFKLGCYKYSNIIETSWMIDNGYYELCKEKVQRGEYLIFGTSRHLMNHHIFQMTRDQLRTKYDNGRCIAIYSQSVFNKQVSIVAKWNTSNFYNHLFRNYSNYFIDNRNSEETEYYLIEYDNLEALSSLYNTVPSNLYKFTFETFHRSVEIGSYECAYFIYQKLGLLNNNEQLVKSENYFKLWNMVLIQNESELSSIEFGLLLNGRIEFLVDKCKLPLPPINTLSSNRIGCLFGFLTFNQKLSTLIQSVKTITWLKYLLHNRLNEVNKKSFKFERSGLISIDEINSINIENQQSSSSGSGGIFDITITISEIECLKFDDQQLNTLVSDFNFIEHPIIFTLFKLILPFQKSSYFLDNYLFLKLKSQSYNSTNDNNINNNITIKSTLSINPSLFGIYNFNELLETKLNTGKITIFHYCKKERRELQINYIKNFIKDITLSTYSDNIQKLINNIFIDLVKLDDIELVKLLFSSGISIKFENVSFSIGLVYKSINSTDMFDLVINNLSRILSNTNLATTTTPIVKSKFSLLYTLIVNSKPGSLLEHYKSNYNELYRNEVGYIDISIEEYISIEIGTIKFIYDNLDGFNYDSINIWKANSRYIFKSLSDYIYIVNRTPATKEYSCNWCYDKYTNYILNHKLHDVPLKRFNCHTENPFYQYVKYKRQGEIEMLFPIIRIKLNTFTNVIDCEVGKHGNCNFVDMLIQTFPIDNKNHYEMMFFLVNTVTNFGQISVFKHLVSNYLVILNKHFEKFIDKHSNKHLIRYAMPPLCLSSGNFYLVMEIIKSIDCVKKVSPNNFHLFVGGVTFDSHLLFNYLKNNKK